MNATPTTSLAHPSVEQPPVIFKNLGTVSVQDLMNNVLPVLLKQQMTRAQKEHLTDCLRKQLFEPLDILFQATTVERTRALEGEDIKAGPAGNLADRYGIRDRGVQLRMEGTRTYVLKFFRHRGEWNLFVSLFDEQALAEEELRRAFQPAHQPRGDHRNGRRAA